MRWWAPLRMACRPAVIARWTIHIHARRSGSHRMTQIPRPSGNLRTVAVTIAPGSGGSPVD